MQNEEIIQRYIMRDMSEGVMAIGFDGILNFINPAAAQILEKSAESLVGKRFASCFFEFEENDSFNQLILDAVYDRSSTHEGIVNYFTGTVQKQLFLKTSFLKNEDAAVGIVCVISDVSELYELRDAVKAMERIRAINGQLELRNRLLSETFGRFLSDEIVRQLLETPDGLALGGKKRCLTVMMSDLRGFTAMSERMQPHSLLDMLNHYLGEMTEIIQRRSGTIIEFIGDGIMAIFGAPAPNENHAADAVAAATEMQMQMQRINAWNAEHGYPSLQMGIGIHTGEVIVGNIGSEKRTKYGVVGSNVNLAGRIESYTVGGQILISPQTRSRISSPLDIAAEQTVLPKGAETPMVLSHVTGIGAPYLLSCALSDETPKPLSAPVDAPFCCIHEKHVDRVPNDGCFTALCKTGAILKTGLSLASYSNLQIAIGEGKLFAKVLSGENGEYLLRFTSLPENFAQWYRQAIS